MSQNNETFFTAVGCMDGRVQAVIAALGKEKFGVSYPDTITEAGLVGKLAHADSSLMQGIKFKVIDVSIGKHHSQGVIVHGHAECAGNPVSDEQQINDIKRSVEVMLSLAGSVPVVGVFVHRDETDSSKWIAAEV